MHALRIVFALRKFLGNQWNFFRRAGVLRRKEVATILGLSVLAVVAEATGMAMIAPILAFLEDGRDVVAFEESSPIAAAVVDTYRFLGLPLNLASLSFVAFAFVLFRQIANYFNQVEVERVKLSIARRLSILAFCRLLSSHRSVVQMFKPGEASVICDYEAQAAAAVVRVYGTIWTTTLSFFAYGAILLVAAPVASLIAAGLLALVAVLLSTLIRRTRRLSEKGVSIRKEQVNFFNERFRAWRLIKLSGALTKEVERANDVVIRNANIRLALARVSSQLMLYFSPIAVGALLVIVYLFADVLEMELSIILLFVLVMLRLIPLAQNYQKQLSLLAQFDPSMRRLDDVFREANAQIERPNVGDAFVAPKEAIKFCDVSFAYEGEPEKAVLESIEARIPAVAITAIIGPSGAGKSTLIDLLCRISDPTKGAVLVDDVALNCYSLRSLRAAIAFVPQEPFIFDATVAENIRYQATDASDDEVMEAARLASAHEFILELPEGYQTRLKDGGGRLSGGQKQRIALARAFAANTPILILDEPTSALDHMSEALIQTAIERIVSERGVTVIVVAHNLSTIQKAHHVIHLDAGSVIAQGPAGEILGLPAEGKI